MKRFLLIAAACLSLAACSSQEQQLAASRSALEVDGFEQPRLTQPFYCDAFIVAPTASSGSGRTGWNFVALKNGYRVKGSVCSGGTNEVTAYRISSISLPR